MTVSSLAPAFDFVEEISTTTGTGDYILGGVRSPDKFPFSRSLTDGQMVSVSVEDGNGDFETGFYTYHSGPNSLSRDYIYDSSNSFGSPVNWGAGTRIIRQTLCSASSGLAYQYHNLAGSGTPSGASNNASQGYGPLSFFNQPGVGVWPQPGRLWVCLASTGTDAIWQEIITSYKPRFKEGTNMNMGAVALVAGVATVNTTQVTANSRIFLQSQVDGGTPGWLRVSARTVSTSFTITSSSNTDTSTVAWWLAEPA